MPGTIAWDDARELVLESFTDFSPTAGDIVGRFFERDWIDAAVRPGKMLGAFCATLVPDVHPYVLMNYAGERRSVLTLAHELGHGLHGVLAQDLGLLNALDAADARRDRVGLRARRSPSRSCASARTTRARGSTCSSAASTTRSRPSSARSRSTASSTRSTRAAARRASCRVERISELWRAEQERMLGDAVEVTEDYGIWWSYVPHFIAAPGYVYAYSFGYLFSLAIYRRYVEEGDSLVEPYLDLLRAGGSAPPAELAARLGFDLSDPGFWSAGLDAIGTLVDEAESLAAQLD